MSVKKIALVDLTRCAAIVAALSAPSVVCAQGVTDTQITVGQTVALSGSVGEHGRALVTGAQAHFDRLNRTGGINGRRVVLVTMDDAGDGKRATENAQALLEKQRVFALFSGAEGGPCVAATKVASAARVPVVGCAGGSPELRDPFNAFSFPVRAPHLEEFDRLLEYAAVFGRKRVAFVHSDSDTGRKHLENVKRLAAQHGVELVLGLPLPSGNAFDAPKIAQQLAAARAEAVLNHGGYGQYAAIIRAAREQGSDAQFLAVNSGAQQMVRLLEGKAPGLIFAQVVPFPWFEATPLVREYREALRAHAPKEEPSFSSLEGYVNAKVLAEGLRRAGARPTRESLAAALEGMRGFDLGGMTVTYGPDQHEGSRFVDIVVVGAKGQFVR
jgi:branched-chain amino acid transport system substrate-binding protein